MEAPVKGDVVVVPFPFSDLSTDKKRPAFVVQSLDGDDIIFCMITSQATSDRYAIPISDADFESGGLQIRSNLRPGKLFTGSKDIVLRKVGQVNEMKTEEIIEKIVELVRS